MNRNFFLHIYILCSAQENSRRSPGKKLQDPSASFYEKPHRKKSYKQTNETRSYKLVKLFHIAHIASYTISLWPNYQMPTCYRLSLVTRWPTNNDLDSRLSLVIPTILRRFMTHNICIYTYIHCYTVLREKSSTLSGSQYKLEEWYTNDQTYGMKNSSGWSSSTYLNFRSGNFCGNRINRNIY